MGVGNYWLENAETVYVDYDDIYSAEEGEDYDFIDQEFEFADFKSNVLSCLPKSFTPTDRYFNREGRVLAKNGFYDLVLVCWEGYVAVNLVVKEEDYRSPWERNPLADYHLTRTAGIIFDKLHALYPLRVRCSGWTSGQYTPSQPLAA